MPPRLLVVEDESNFASLLAMALRKEGYQVEVSDSVEQAMDYLNRETIDLLITDWMLPDGTGGQVCAVARNSGRLLPIIVLSGAMNERSQTIVDCNPDAFMAKPVRMAHLLMQVRDLLDTCG